MPSYLQRARTALNPLNYNAENVCRESQAQVVTADVERRRGHLPKDVRDYIKGKLIDRPSGFRPQDQSGYISSVDKNKVVVKDDTLKYTRLLTTDHMIVNPWYGKQRLPKSHKTRSANCSSNEGGRNWVEWVSEEEIEDRNGLHRIQRHHAEEDMAFRPSCRRKSTSNKQALVFKSSFSRKPYSPTPFHMKVDNSIEIERSDFGKRFIRGFQPRREEEDDRRQGSASGSKPKKRR